MTEITETQEENEFVILEGIYQQAEQKTKLFTNLTALADYIDAFKISNGHYAKGVLRDSGKTVWQLTYLSGE